MGGGEGKTEQFGYQMASPRPGGVTSPAASGQIAPLWEASPVLLHNSTTTLINDMH